MKKIIFVTVLAGLFLAATLALGQAGQGKASGTANCPFDGQGPGSRMHQGRGMGPGMGQGMGQGFRGRGFGFDGRGTGMFQCLRFKDELGLTDTQIEQMKKMQTDFQMERIDKRAELEKVQIRLRNLMTDDNAQESTVFSAIDDAARLKADMKKMNYQHRQQFRKVLTEDQLNKLKELRQNRGHRFMNNDDDDDNTNLPRRGRNR